MSTVAWTKVFADLLRAEPPTACLEALEAAFKARAHQALRARQVQSAMDWRWVAEQVRALREGSTQVARLTAGWRP